MCCSSSELELIQNLTKMIFFDTLLIERVYTEVFVAMESKKATCDTKVYGGWIHEARGGPTCLKSDQMGRNSVQPFT
jgi:hypothetical protein